MASKEPEEGQEQPKKKSPMLFIIIGVLVVALGGGGFFAYTKFFKKAPAESAEEEGGGDHGGGGGHGGQGGQGGGASLVMDWDSFLVNLADPGGKRYLKVTMKLEMTSISAQTEFTAKNVALRDAVLMLLSSKEFEDISTAGGKQTLKQEIMARVNKALQKGQVKEVYFTDFLVQ